ncbi:hypothetical protein ABTH68_19625, partial [Acinetobacter baumannii]
TKLWILIQYLVNILRVPQQNCWGAFFMVLTDWLILAYAFNDYLHCPSIADFILQKKIPQYPFFRGREYQYKLR